MLRSIIGAVVGNRVGRGSNGILGAGLGIAATRLATSSIPGALIVGGALLAKTLYDKRQRDRNAISRSASTLTLPPATPSPLPTVPPTLEH